MNLATWFIDLISMAFQTPRYSVFPSMYNNALAKSILQSEDTIWGPFKYYDLFTIQGLYQYYLDRFFINFFFPLELTFAIIRDVEKDWNILRTDFLMPTNKNTDFFGIGDSNWGFWIAVLINTLTLNIFSIPLWSIVYLLNLIVYFVTDNDRRYDQEYWEDGLLNTNGYDCNGNVGPGMYCFCPSQGYLCGCDHESYDTKLICFDHEGYDCNGSLVDGRPNWCKDPENFYYIFNKESHNL